MAILTREQLQSQWKRREISPVYLMFGAETYLRDRAVKAICDVCFSEGEARDFNETEFSLNWEGNLASALAAAQQLPMMSQKRVIRITDVRVTATGRLDTLREDDEDALTAYLKNPAPFSVVIFISDEFDKRRKMAKTLIESATAVEFSELNDIELGKWARDEVKKIDSEIDDRALRLLISLVGPDVRRLTTEIKKLSTAALPDKMISAELIGSLVSDAREISNFDFSGHLFAGRKREALKTLRKSLDDGAEPVMLVGLLSSNVRRLLMAKEAMASGVDRGEVARIAKLRYSDQEAFMATARRVDEKSLVRAIRRIAETDLAIKTSVGGGTPHGPRMQVEMLVAELALLS